jgi:hypothetical protein
LGAIQASRKDEIMDFPDQNGWCFIQNQSIRKNLCMISTCFKLITCPPLVLLLPFLQAIPPGPMGPELVRLGGGVPRFSQWLPM